MKNVIIETSVTDDPDFSGGLYYVEAGSHFNLLDYCAHAKVRPRDVDQESWQAAQNKAGELFPGQWLLVEHYA